MESGYNINMSNNEFIIWYTNINEIIDENHLLSLISVRNKLDQDRVLFYKFINDKIRSYLSILLQRKLIQYYWKLNENQYEILRSNDNKPYLSSISTSKSLWNYNVSHHGEFVAIASHSNCLVGIDLVDVFQRNNLSNSFRDFVNMFTKQFHPIEIQTMKLAESERLQYVYFYVNWALKEAFVKAIGVGLGYPLLQTRFYILFEEISVDEELSNVKILGTAKLFINDKQRDDWRFEFKNIDNKHVMAVCFGPCNDASQSFRQSCWSNIDDNMINENDNNRSINNKSIINISSVMKYKSLIELS